MELVVPHLRRGLLIGRRIACQRAVAAAVHEALDGLRTAIILVDAHGWIVHANVSGLAMLAQGSSVRSVRGKLTAAKAETETLLSKSIAKASDHKTPLDDRATAMPLTSANGQRDLIHVLPLASGFGRVPFGANRRAAIALIVREETISSTQPVNWIAHHFGLAPRERDVLRAIVETGGIGGTAEKLTIAESTAKTLLRRVFEKTGMRRQVDLIKLCASFSDPFLR